MNTMNTREAQQAQETQEARIRELFAEYCRTWTEADSAGFGRLFTQDADYVSYDGSWAAGAAELRDNHDKLFRGVIAGLDAVENVAGDDAACAPVRYRPSARGHAAVRT
ncbi:SgcJ/EcaC family oxidoreductase [Streptomyces sp. NPDC002851]